MAPKNISIDDLFRTHSIAEIRVAPGGAHAAVVVKSPNVLEQRNDTALWLWSRDGNGFRPLTNGHADAMPRWLDEETLLFTGRKESKDGKPPIFPKALLYSLSLRGGEPRLRAKLDGVLHECEPSPDGRTLALAYSKHPTVDEKQLKVWEKAPPPLVSHRFRLRIDGMGDLPQHLPSIYLLDTKGETWKKPKPLVEDEQYWDANMQWLPDGKSLLFVRGDIDAKFGTTRVLIADRKGRTRELALPDGDISALAVSPDGTQLAFAGNEDPRRGHLKSIPVCVRSMDPKDKKWRVLAHDGGNFGEARLLSDVAGMTRGLLRWEDGENLLAMHTAGGDSRLVRVNTGDGSVRSLSPERGQAYMFDARDGAVLFAHASPTQPGELFVAGRAKPVSRFNAAVAKKYNVEPRAHVTKTEKNVSVESFLWATKSQLAAKKKHSLPLVLMVHGGPQVGTGNIAMHEYTWLAHQGFAVLTANPRGSSGYGDAHGLGIYGNWGDRDVHDLLTLLKDTLKRHPQFDPARVFIAGGSYGGYMTNWMLTRHPGLFRAGVTMRSVSNGISFAGTSDFSTVFPPMEIGVENIWEDPMKVWKLSPISQIGRVTDPLLIMHSDNDWRCHDTEAHQLFVGLVEHGKKINEDVRLVIFKGESHGLSRGGRPENRRVRLEEMLAWLKKHDTPRRKSAKRRK